MAARGEHLQMNIGCLPILLSSEQRGVKTLGAASSSPETLPATLCAIQIPWECGSADYFQVSILTAEQTSSRRDSVSLTITSIGHSPRRFAITGETRGWAFGSANASQ